MKILIPVDGSPQSDAALDFVASRSTLVGRSPQVELLNVQPTVSARISRAVGREEVKAFQRAQADEVLRPALARLAQAGLKARASYVPGSRPDAIGDVAVRGRADLIVMGSRGHSGLKGLLFGSMTYAVLAGCSKPMLILRSDKAPRRDSLTVGIAVDGSRHSLAAVRWAIRHRDLFGAEPRIELIHVVEKARSVLASLEGLDPRAAAAVEPIAADHALTPVIDKSMAAAVKALTQAGMAFTEVRLLAAVAGDAIAAHARKRPLDVLVMGSHGHGSFKSLVLGSVTMRVAARCDKPLLLIREPARATAG